MTYREELKEYDAELIDSSIFTIMRFGKNLVAECIKYEKWLNDRGKNGSELKFMPLLLEASMSQCISAARDAGQIKNLREFATDIWKAYDSGMLLDPHQKILEEMCVEKYTWRMLKTTYITNRRIQALKDEALESMRKMVLLDEEN